MPIAKPRNVSFLRALGIFALGLVSGVQIALYLYDYYDDGVVDMQSLLIGIGMVAAAVGFILVSFTEAKAR